MQQPGEYRLESLYGQEPPPEEMVLGGMAHLESELTRRFERRLEQQRQTSVHQEKVRRPLIEVVRQDPEAAEGVRGRREQAASWKREHAQQLLEVPLPQAPEVTQRIFTGSIGATVTAPYDYPWTWSTTTGSPGVSVSADKTNGRMGLDIWTNSDDESSASAAVALGIFFKPMTANGILRLSSNPSFNYSWGTWAVFDSARSDAFIGLYVGSYTLGGGFDGAPVDQESVLWSDDSWWDSGGHQGTNSGYPLFAQFNVDNSHWYALWVWCGGSASGAGWGTFSGSAAESGLTVALRSITWELFGC